MKKQQLANIVQEILDQTFPNPEIPLKHTSPYTLLIAVLLSAQCTDARVNKVTPKLFARASTPYKMISLSIEEITELIRECGLYNTKAKAIYNLSRQLIDQHGGEVPKTLEELEELPGVGHKTASVVVSHTSKTPAFPVDTHIHRCAKRWGLSGGKNVVQTEKDLKALFPEKSWEKLHLQIIYYARKYCPARGHKTADCPICQALEKLKQLILR